MSNKVCLKLKLLYNFHLSCLSKLVNFGYLKFNIHSLNTLYKLLQFIIYNTISYVKIKIIKIMNKSLILIFVVYKTN